MKTINMVSFIILLSAHQLLLASEEECLSTTNPIHFSASDRANISQQINQKDSARTFTFFNNGDLLIASVETCGLGLELLYLSQLPFESTTHRADKLSWLVNLNGRDVASLLPANQLEKVTLDFSINGEMGDEIHVLKSSQLISTTDIYPETFSASLGYIWIAPSGAE